MRAARSWRSTPPPRRRRAARPCDRRRSPSTRTTEPASSHRHTRQGDPVSDIPPYRPDPTRDASGDTIGDAADESAESAESAEESATADVAADPGTPADPADLPTVGSAPEGVTAYDTTFGLQPAPPSSWVPQRAGGRAAPTPPPPPATRPSDVVGPRTITLPPAATRSLGGRLQAWHVVAIMVGLLVPIGF